MSELTNDPYGGFRETWPAAVLNSAGAGQTLAFQERARRPMPLLNQITFPDAGHYEICGFDELACCAYAVGLVEDVVATLHQILADARAHGYDPGRGSDRGELLSLAQHRGWSVDSIDGPAGDVGERLAAAGRVGLTVLNTAYGAGAQWNVLHPVGGGRVGHWEGVGAIACTSTEEEPMTSQEQQQVATSLSIVVRNQYLQRTSTLEEIEGTAADMVARGFDQGAWAVIGSDEARAKAATRGF